MAGVRGVYDGENGTNGENSENGLSLWLWCGVCTPNENFENGENG